MVTINIKLDYEDDFTTTRAYDDLKIAIIEFDPFQTNNFLTWIPFFSINQLPYSITYE